MKRNFLIPTIVFLLILAGCAVGPNYEEAEYTGPDSFRFDSMNIDTTEILSWWELFNDPVLDTLIATGLRNNLDVAAAGKRLQAAWASVGFFRADMYPKIDVAAGATRGNFIAGQVTEVGNQFYGFGQLSWELDFWGKYRRATEAARAELLASEYGMRSIQISLITTIASLYFDILNFDEQLKISRRTLTARDSTLSIVKARFEMGIVPELDLNQAQIQRAISAAAIPLFERNIAQSEHAMKVILGEYPDAVTTGMVIFDQALPPDIPAGLPSLLLERRPDIRESAELYHAQLARVGVAQAQRFPAISITGALGTVTNDLSKLTSAGLTWSIGGDLLGPLFHFNKNKRRMQIELFRAEELQINYDNNILRAFQEVEDVLITISTLKDELKARQQQSDAAMNAEFLSQHRYDRGVTSYLEVLESQRSSFDAQLALVSTYSSLLISYVNLYKVLGGGWITPEEKQIAEEAAEQGN